MALAKNSHFRSDTKYLKSLIFAKSFFRNIVPKGIPGTQYLIIDNQNEICDIIFAWQE